MTSAEQIEWVEPKWARKEHRPTLLSFARQTVPRRWLLMTVAATLVCGPSTWLLAKLYSQSFVHMLLVSLLLVWSLMIGLPAVFLLLGYAVGTVITTKVRVGCEEIVYGSMTRNVGNLSRIRLDRSSTTRPRLLVQDTAGNEFWIGVAPHVDLDLLQCVCTESVT